MKSHLQDSFLFLINLHFTRNCIRIYQLNLMTIPDVCFHKSLKIGQLMTHNDSHHLDENLIGCQLTNFLRKQLLGNKFISFMAFLYFFINFLTNSQSQDPIANSSRHKLLTNRKVHEMELHLFSDLVTNR
jgi:hypothetical protein